jgi:hypothetical protein
MRVPQPKRCRVEERETLKSSARVVKLKREIFFLDSRAIVVLGRALAFCAAIVLHTRGLVARRAAS